MTTHFPITLYHFIIIVINLFIYLLLCRVTTSNKPWVPGSSAAGGGPGPGGMRGRPSGGMSGQSSGGSGVSAASYLCRRCGKMGHFLNQCPTQGDSTYDKPGLGGGKLYAVSTGSRKKVTSLDNIDTKSNTVIITHLYFIYVFSSSSSSSLSVYW